MNLLSCHIVVVGFPASHGKSQGPNNFDDHAWHMGPPCSRATQVATTFNAATWLKPKSTPKCSAGPPCLSASASRTWRLPQIGDSASQFPPAACATAAQTGEVAFVCLGMPLLSDALLQGAPLQHEALARRCSAVELARAPMPSA